MFIAWLREKEQKLVDLWCRTESTNFFFRLGYISWRIGRAIVLRSPTLSKLTAWLSEGKQKIVNLWRHTQGSNFFYRFGYVSWRIGRAIVLRLINLGRNILIRYFFALVFPLNVFLSITRRKVKYPNSVLHISYMVHIPYYTTRLLRRYGLKADYLAVGGQSSWWRLYDYNFLYDPLQPWQEFRFFWDVVAKYEVIHAHFGIFLSFTNSARLGWELPFLKLLGRRIVVHYRGCEVRDPLKIVQMHPDINICQDCDYNQSVCRDGKERVKQAKKYGDVFLVTTPDMKDFEPEAIQFPFFLPEIDGHKVEHQNRRKGDSIKIVHVTNHPGIEGTTAIQQAIDNLKAKGYPIEFVFLKGVTPERVLEEYRDADLSIGKMKMGYYANAQVESMYMGIPTITYVRPEFMTPDLADSGFIFCRQDELEETMEFYLNNPELLEEKRGKAQSSILRLHNSDRLVRELMSIYGFKNEIYECFAQAQSR